MDDWLAKREVEKQEKEVKVSNTTKQGGTTNQTKPHSSSLNKREVKKRGKNERIGNLPPLL